MGEADAPTPDDPTYDARHRPLCLTLRLAMHGVSFDLETDEPTAPDPATARAP